MKLSGSQTAWWLAFGISLGSLGGCQSLPSLEGRSQSSALSETEASQTTLGKAVAPRAEEHPEKSGILALSNPQEAFAARALLAQAAERTLDVQYYIWQDDITGTLLFQALHDAATRGVRVRLLLDDMNTVGLDPLLLALDSHPNIAIRLFNPFVHRTFRPLDFVLHFSRANRRMHNKSFTADNEATIVGGRNVADEYFGASENTMFADLDVLAVGPVVDEISRDFDRYWASRSAYPLEDILTDSELENSQKLSTALQKVKDDKDAQAYLEALKSSGTIEALVQGRLPLEWAHTQLISDDPAKGVGEASEEALLTYELKPIIGEAQTKLELVSAYFVPTKVGTEALVAMAEKGVDITVLTNSLEATDVIPVHAGYAKRRKALLKAGITLYEVRAASAEDSASQNTGPFGSSAASLHAKTFAVDGERLFVGSFNFDPRSAKLNTELGLVIESPEMAKRVSQAFETAVPKNAYLVKLAQDGDLYWLAQQNGKLERFDTEPNTSLWERIGTYVLAKLPIEWLL